MIQPDAARIEKRTIICVADLGVEAYPYTGVQQRFPLHFHDDHVFGCIECGRRRSEYARRSYALTPGDLALCGAGKQVAACRAAYRLR